MFKRLVICGILFSTLFSCKKTNYTEGYTRDKNGYYYKLLGIGDGNDPPKLQSILVVDAVMKTVSDSVFWDTKHDAANGFFIPLDLPYVVGSCQSHFLKMVEGDSISFLIRSAVFFKDYFNVDIPPFCKNDSLIKIDIKLNQIISKAEYETLKKNAESNDAEDKELEELQFIDSYLVNHYKLVKPDGYGIYTLDKTHTNLEKVGYGKRIKFEYKGFYLDGRPIDGVTQELEITYGTPDQLIKGLNIVIGTLKKGETTKIIVPSRLAFGELGSSNGSILPYTPLVYDIKLIDIK